MNKGIDSALVLVEDFDLAAIRQAFAEGRLYMKPAEKSAEVIRQEGIHAILQYVSRIDDCTSSNYHSYIQEIWERILQDEVLGELFFLARYNHNRGEVNWYRVTSVVGILREMNVYRKNDFNFLQLHLLLEGIQRRNIRYTGSTHYFLESREMAVLKQIIQEFEKK